MSKLRMTLIFFGVASLLAYGTLAVAQWRGAMALSSFRVLQKEYPPDSHERIPPSVLERKLASLRGASRLIPDDPEPAYQEALLRLVEAESLSLSPARNEAELQTGPDPSLLSPLQQGFRAIRRALLLNPGSAEQQYLAALLLQNLSSEAPPTSGDALVPDLVAYHLENSRRLDPHRASLRYRIGAFEMALGNNNTAQSDFSIALEQDPSLAKEIFGVLWASTSSASDLRASVKHDPRVCVLMGEFFMDRGFTADATVEYEEAAAHGGDDFQVISGLIRYFFRLKDYDKVLDLVKKVERSGKIKNLTQQAALRYSAGQAFYNNGDFDSAISAYEAALKLDDTRLHIHHSLAQAFLKHGDYAKAVARWDFVLASDEGKRQLGAGVESAHLGLAQAYEKQGRYAEALAEYLRVSKINPKNMVVVSKIQEMSRRL